MPRGTPFPPGVSGNPNGRPKTRFTTNDYLNLARQKCSLEDWGKIVARHVDHAMNDKEHKASLESAKWLAGILMPDAKTAVDAVLDDARVDVTVTVAKRPAETTVAPTSPVAPPPPEPAPPPVWSDGNDKRH